jgi:predicted trehalose synthase
MLRGFDHVARSGMRRSGQPVEQVAAGATPADPAIDAWLTRMRAGFLGAYLEEAAALGLEADLDRPLLHAIEVEKELYEFAYAATFLTAWRYSPAAGLRWLLDHGPEHA